LVSRAESTSAAQQCEFGHALRVAGPRLELRYRRRCPTVVELLLQCHRLDAQIVAVAGMFWTLGKMVAAASRVRRA
jgi:hypothetical protein